MSLLLRLRSSLLGSTCRVHYGISFQRFFAPSKPEVWEDGLHILIALDSKGAKVYRTLLHNEHAAKVQTHEYKFSHHLHNKHMDVSHGKNAEAQLGHFFKEVEHVIQDSESVILAGHGKGKASILDMLTKHIKVNRKDLEKKIFSVLHVDTHTTENQMLKMARELYSGHVDKRKLPQQ